MECWWSSPGSGLLHNTEAEQDVVLDTSEMVDEQAEEADCKSIERRLDSHFDKDAIVIYTVATVGGDGDCRHVDGDPDWRE